MATIPTTRRALDPAGEETLGTYRKLRALMGRPIEVLASPVAKGPVRLRGVPDEAVEIAFAVQGATHSAPVKNGAVAASALTKLGVARGDVIANVWFLDADGHPVAAAAPFTF